MNYPGNIFYDLMDRAVQAGAEHLDAICKARTYTVDSGQIDVEHEDGKVRKFHPKGKAQTVTLGSCAQSALFHIPYEGEDRDAGLMGLTVCAVDDAMGAMPKYGGDRLATMDTRELFYIHGDKLEKDDPRVLGK